MKTNFKTYCTIMGIMLMNTLVLPTALAVDESPCNRHYEAAIKFVVDTPVIHPFSVSPTGKVIFSSGNLQYCPKYEHIVQLPGGGQRKETIKDVFRFAPRQIDRCTDGHNWGTTPPDSISWGNVWYDSVVKASVKSAINTSEDSFYAVKRKATSCISTYSYCNYPNGPTIDYKGWMDLLHWGSSCQGKRACDPNAEQFMPHELGQMIDYSATTPANTWHIGPSYYASPAQGNAEGWKTDVKRNNFDTNSGPSRYFDWGYANVIREYTECTQQDANGNSIHSMDSTLYRPGVWRTLTADEWEYLLISPNRKIENQDSLWTMCTIEDPENGHHYIYGFILYPDDFSFTSLGMDQLPLGNLNYTKADTIRISWSDWTRFEDNGCVFLPANHLRPGPLATLGNFTVLFDMRYWSSTAIDASKAYVFHHASGGFNPKYNNYNRYAGLGVRLVQDVH